MANCCFLTIETNDANYHKRLKSRINKHGSIKLCKDRYLFDADFTEGYTFGWVKWGINPKEIIAIIKKEGFRYFKCTYEEGCMHGVYEFTNGILIEKEIPEDHKIWDTEYEGDQLEEILESVPAKELWEQKKKVLKNKLLYIVDSFDYHS